MSHNLKNTQVKRTSHIFSEVEQSQQPEPSFSEWVKIIFFPVLFTFENYYYELSRNHFVIIATHKNSLSDQYDITIIVQST